MIQVFFEIHKDLPREGPGDSQSTRKAFSMLVELPKQPLILDIGCGPGMQTLDLIALTDCKIVAVDNHQPFLDQLSKKAAQKGVTERITVVNADMSSLDFEKGTFDLIWAEGSAYTIGFENALRTWKPLLKRPGYLAATEIAWTKPAPPEELQRFWAEEYPLMQDIESNLAAIRRAGYSAIGYFVLPESAWWHHYYTPVEQKLVALREEYKDNPKALAVVEFHQREIDLYRQYSNYYGYVFYVMEVDI